MSGPSARDLAAVALRACDLIDDALGMEDGAEREALLAEASAMIDGLADNLPGKLDACRAVAVRMEAEAGVIREEEQRLARRRRACDAGSARIRASVGELLAAWRETGGDKVLRTQAGSYWLQASSSVVGPERVEDWPAAWQRVTVAPDRAAATRAAKDGELPDGFTLAWSESVRWR